MSQTITPVEQNDSINSMVRKGSFNEQTNYRKIPKSLIDLSLELESWIKSIDGYEINENISDTISYTILKERRNPKRKETPIKIRPKTGLPIFTRTTHTVVLTVFLKGGRTPKIVIQDNRVFSPYKGLLRISEVEDLNQLKMVVMNDEYGYDEWDLIEYFQKSGIGNSIHSSEFEDGRTIHYLKNDRIEELVEITPELLNEVVL